MNTYNTLKNPKFCLALFIVLFGAVTLGIAYQKSHSFALYANFKGAFNSLENFTTNKIQQEVVELKITKGDTLMKLLIKNGVKPPLAQNVINNLSKVYNLKKLHLGQKVTLVFNKEKKVNENNLAVNSYELMSMRIKIDSFQYIDVINQQNEILIQPVTIELKKHLTKVDSIIESSFMATAMKLGISSDALLELTRYYSYDVDFQRDIKLGDRLDLIFERYYDAQGNFSHNGAVLFSCLTVSGKKINLYRYEKTDGEIEYYHDDGSSVKKDLLRTPLNVARISSGFGNRRHPILGYSKMHKGIDFAASIGTPIFAAGNGVIQEIGRKGAYGNYIRIRHANGYSTAYAHASAFGKGLVHGSKVKQGDVIAYVGSTGRSTGPHLHYEVLVNNVNINPLKIKMSKGEKLSGRELSKFNQYKTKIEKVSNLLANNNELAINKI
jgi:murein DD-endopeptidase MepM/ murein hydrolase activator NlpD